MNVQKTAIIYSTTVKFAANSKCELNFDWRSNLCFTALTTGQMVTVGNGIVEIACSLKSNFVGTSFQCTQTVRIIEPHNQSDKLTAIIHHNLEKLLNNILWVNTQWVTSIFQEYDQIYLLPCALLYLSLQWSIWSVKYRMPWILLFSQNSVNILCRNRLTFI